MIVAAERGGWGAGDEEVLLTSGGQRQGMLLNVLQCIAWLPQQKIIRPQTAKSAKVQKPSILLREKKFSNTEL